MNKRYFIIAIFVLVFFVVPGILNAGISDNVSGFAWSENIGWVSFSSENDHDPDTAGVQPSPISYGVNVDDTTGVFSGFAWSDTIGWIKFDPGPDFDTGLYPDLPQSSAILDLATNQASGWARACAGTVNGDCASSTRTDGWDGWIKMAGDVTGGGTYGVIYDIDDREFKGWAWGSDVVGWLSFNCDNDHGAGSVCGTSDYAVVADINQPPSVSNLTVIRNDMCAPGPTHTFFWQYDDDDGNNADSYQLQVAEEMSLQVDITENNPPPGSSVTMERQVQITPTLDDGNLDYGETYYWRVKVFDSEGKDSGWIEAGSTFPTSPHLYPTSDFTVSPESPSEGEEITFAQASTCYDASNGPTPPPSCFFADENYSWDFDYKDEDGDTFPDFTQDATGQTATTTYADTDNHTIALDVTDADGQTCRGTKDISPQSPLPKFRETAPTSFLKNLKTFMASITSVRMPILLMEEINLFLIK